MVSYHIQISWYCIKLPCHQFYYHSNHICKYLYRGGGIKYIHNELVHISFYIYNASFLLLHQEQLYHPSNQSIIFHRILSRIIRAWHIIHWCETFSPNNSFSLDNSLIKCVYASIPDLVEVNETLAQLSWHRIIDIIIQTHFYFKFLSIINLAHKLL